MLIIAWSIISNFLREVADEIAIGRVRPETHITICWTPYDIAVSIWLTIVGYELGQNLKILLQHLTKKGY